MAELVVQPTDCQVRSVFVSLLDAETARRNERDCGIVDQGLVDTHTYLDRSMKDRLIRLAIVCGAVVATALAGGASLRGF